MQKHYSYITIDLDKKIYTKPKAVQGDSKSRYILANLIDNNVFYDLSGTSVKVYGVKKDKKIFFNDATIVDAIKGQFEIELTNQALAVAGDLKVQILILGPNQEKLSTFSFFIEVVESIIDDTAIESSNEFTALITSLSKLEEWNGYFEETSGKIEEKYTERLNNLDEQFNTFAKKAIFTFILDDAHIGDFYQAKPVFDEFGWVFSSALCPQRFWRDRNNGICTSKLHPYLRYQEEKGMSLITHGLSHADLRNTVNENQVISEIIQGRKTVEKLGFKTCGFVPANSTVNSAYKHYLKENYSYAYNTYRGNITTMKGQGLKCYNTKQDDYYSLLRISLADSVNSLDEIKSLIDEVVENKGFLTFYDHNIGNVGNASGTDASATKLREILTYIKSYEDNGKCKVLSTDEAVAEYYGINLRYDTTKTFTTEILKNVFTPNQTGATNANDMWYIPSPFTVVNDKVINLKLTSTITAGTSYQFYYNLDLSKIDLNDIENHIKAMIRSDVVTMSTTQDIQLTIEGRFMTTSTGLNDVFKIWYERGTHKVSLFPINSTDDIATQLRIIFKITFNKELSEVELNLTKPTIFI